MSAKRERRPAVGTTPVRINSVLVWQVRELAARRRDPVRVLLEEWIRQGLRKRRKVVTP
jgi:hypothetical protein